MHLKTYSSLALSLLENYNIYMKELTLKDIQSLSLDILSNLHEFCISRNINYSLGYGTLIGAIRHKGFIPWDDDLDIMMPRPDFERFCQEYKSSNQYKLYAPSLGNSYITYARICDVQKTIVKSHAPWNKDKTGVWIDIFPIDGAPDDFEEQVERFNICKKLYNKQLDERYIIKRWLHGGIKGKISFIKEYLKGKGRIKKITQKYDSFCREIPFGSTQHLTGISCPNANVNLFYDLEDFKEFFLVPFEDRQFMIANGYDHILRCQYHNYMNLPPVEKQVPCHSGHIFLWK